MSEVHLYTHTHIVIFWGTARAPPRWQPRPSALYHPLAHDPPRPTLQTVRAFDLMEAAIISKHSTLRGYLAHKKTPTPLDPLEHPRHRPTAGS